MRHAFAGRSLDDADDENEYNKPQRRTRRSKAMRCAGIVLILLIRLYYEIELRIHRSRLGRRPVHATGVYWQIKYCWQSQSACVKITKEKALRGQSIRVRNKYTWKVSGRT